MEAGLTGTLTTIPVLLLTPVSSNDTTSPVAPGCRYVVAAFVIFVFQFTALLISQVLFAEPIQRIVSVAVRLKSIVWLAELSFSEPTARSGTEPRAKL